MMRELRALTAAAEELQVRKLTIVTLEAYQRLAAGGFAIEAVPAWEWCVDEERVRGG